MEQFAGRFNGKSPLPVAHFNGHVNVALPYFREASFLSTSSNFLSRAFSISARCSLYLSCSISICACSCSVRASGLSCGGHDGLADQLLPFPQSEVSKYELAGNSHDILEPFRRSFPRGKTVPDDLNALLQCDVSSLLHVASSSRILSGIEISMSIAEMLRHLLFHTAAPMSLPF